MATSRFAIVVAILTVALLNTDRRVRADEERASVEGTITLDGKPLPGARVFFHQKDGQFIGAKTNDDGKFRVKGVPTGTYKVTVELLKDGKSLLPRRYADEGASELQVEIKKGVDTLDFDLRSK
jgi:Carboxypeptidase regulatory-like domain